jgi:tetratricopeptide (TPR) repeat protein
MADPAKRLAYLEKITREGSTDPFHWYALAQEYRSLSRWDEAMQTFTTLRTQKPDYVPAYLMCGQMLEKVGRKDEARDWLEAGIEVATRVKDSHALSELQSALGTLGD